MTCTLIHGDCLEEMMKLANDGVKVDMILTDPPYGTTRNKWDTIIPLDKMWECINKLTYERTPVLLFSQLPFTVTLCNSNMDDLRYEWIWMKEQGTGHLNANKMPLKSHENILVFYKKLPVYNPQMRGDEVRVVKRLTNSTSSNYGEYDYIPLSTYTGRYPIDIIQFDKDRSRIHPTQKPVSLLEYLIETYTNHKDLVLDFTMGSGSVGVACQNTNRNFIGIELEEKYYNIAKKRCSEYQSKLW